MIVYVDSSAAIRWIMKTPGYYKSFGRWKSAGSSVLLEIECHRALDRLRLEGMIGDEDLSRSKEQLQNLVSSIYIFGMDEPVTDRARQNFPTIIKTLDAIHLSTALLWQEEIQHDIHVLSHDNQMIICARALGLKII